MCGISPEAVASSRTPAIILRNRSVSTFERSDPWGCCKRNCSYSSELKEVWKPWRGWFPEGLSGGWESWKAGSEMGCSKHIGIRVGPLAIPPSLHLPPFFPCCPPRPSE